MIKSIKITIALLGQKILKILNGLDNYAKTQVNIKIRSQYSDMGLYEAELTKKEIGGNVEVGRWTWGGSDSKVFTVGESDKVIIGKFCSFANGVRLFGGGEHGHRTRVSTFHFRAKILRQGFNADAETRGVLKIGNDVWIGTGAMIMSGIEIGDGVVIGMGAVVNKSIPPYAIVVGNPARIVGYRFSPEIIEKLLQIKWWDWDDRKIIDSIDDFYGDVEKFVSKYAPVK